MSKPIVLIMQDIPKESFAPAMALASNYTFHFLSDATPFPIDEVEIVFGWDAEVGNQLLASPTSKLKWIQSFSAGVDYLDLSIIKKKNILLTNASGVHGIQIAESIMGMLLAHTRGIRQSILDQQKKTWSHDIPTSELYGTNMLIVGTGHIGKRLAELATAFGIHTYGINRSGYELTHFEKTYPQNEIDSVLPTMDIVVNILPLTKETHYFYDKERFSHMKNGVFFINIGRGPSVNSTALYEACHTGKIAFAGIDVFEEEPLPLESPLWALDNLMITPHLSGQTANYLKRLLPIFEENLRSYLHSKTVTKSVVQLDLGY